MEYVTGYLFDSYLDRVLLIKKNGKAVSTHKDKFHGIGGKVEPKEKPIQAMRREFKEETGLSISKWNCFGELHARGDVIYLFSARNEKIVNFKQKTDEEVDMFNVFSFFKNLLVSYVIVPNTYWMVNMAIVNEMAKNDKQYFKIFEE